MTLRVGPLNLRSTKRYAAVARMVSGLGAGLPSMNDDELKQIARARMAESFGHDYLRRADTAEFIDGVAWSLARGCLVILDSQSHVIYFKNVYSVGNERKHNPAGRSRRVLPMVCR